MANYKDTMNLPSTDFAMRANLPENEPKRLAWWNEIDIYHRVLQLNENNTPFVLHDGPPYANGPIHIGHAFNKILKDFVVKSHAQLGYFTPYVPGWDCHGQPIEHMVEKTLGPEKMAQTSQPELRKLCHDWAKKYIDIQREGFKRLGVNADWDNPYLTYLHEYEAGNVEIFKDLYLKGAVYRGRKPIHWCKRCHTALAEAEIEYSDETSHSIYVAFEMDEVPAPYAAAGVTNAWVLIWTTTPWTLPANAAVSFAPEADYCVVRTGGKDMIMAKELVETVAEVCGWESYELLKDAAGDVVLMKGTDFTGMTYTCPIRTDLKGKCIYGDHVTLDSGTGCVHTAPGHGQDDYLVGLEFDVDMRMPVDDNGVFTKAAGQFAGMDIDEANPKIIEHLHEVGTLIGATEITHSYPHCWRCKQPVIFRATDQWFVSMDKTGLREKALNEIEHNVTWYPEWAHNRIGSMVADRPDWCISRQRSWGVPIPVFRCKDCGEVVATAETFDAVIKLFNEEGADAWFTRKPEEYLPADTHCEHCGCTEVVPEKDILDVWWESGVSHTSVCKKRPQLTFPADMYLEGSDQHRGWFQSSLLTSVGAYGHAPYKSVLHCGFTVDEQGRKMSKSLGNGIDPAEVEKKYGAEILRLWVSSVDYSQDVSISDNILNRVSDSYRKLRNTFRFLLGNLADFDDERDAIKNFDELTLIDQWAYLRLQKLVSDVTKAYESFRFHQVYRYIYDYVVGDLSAVYLDPLKDRLYSEAADAHVRRSAQTVLWNILEALVRVLSPILSFTTEEVWQHYPEAARNRENRPLSVQLAGWPTARVFTTNVPEDTTELMSTFATLLEVREAVTKALEDARNAKVIGKSQEAVAHISLPADQLELVSSVDASVLEELFIVAEVRLTAADEVQVEITHTELSRCPRCWNYRELGSVSSHEDLCERCAHALEA